MTDQQYGPYEFEVYVYSLEGRTLNYPVYFATRVYSHRRAQATYRGVVVTLDSQCFGEIGLALFATDWSQSPRHGQTRALMAYQPAAPGDGLSGQWPVAAATSRHLTQDSCGSAEQDGAIGNGFDEEGP